MAAPERTDLEVARRDEAREMREALEQLPEEQSRVIELAYFGGLTHVQIASMLDAPVGTIKGRMRLGPGEDADDARRPRGGAAMSTSSQMRRRRLPAATRRPTSSARSPTASTRRSSRTWAPARCAARRSPRCRPWPRRSRAPCPSSQAPAALKRRVMAEVQARGAERAGAARARLRARALRDAQAAAGARRCAAGLAAVLADRDRDRGQAAAAARRAGASRRVAPRRERARAAQRRARRAEHSRDARRRRPGRVYELWVKRAGAPEADHALFTVTLARRRHRGRSRERVRREGAAGRPREPLRRRVSCTRTARSRVIVANLCAPAGAAGSARSRRAGTRPRVLLTKWLTMCCARPDVRSVLAPDPPRDPRTAGRRRAERWARRRATSASPSPRSAGTCRCSRRRARSCA